MPELPDVSIYVERLNALVAGQRLNNVALNNPFVLRTALPPVKDIEQQTLTQSTRLAKRIVLEFGNGHLAVIHLMIAGRLHWTPTSGKRKAPKGLLTFNFDDGTLTLTEAGKKRRASLHLLADKSELAQFDRGGLELFDIDEAQFSQRIRENNHTIKRALTDQRIIAGIGNAYSDEILHRARLSPFLLTQSMSDKQARELFTQSRNVLREWQVRLREQAGDKFLDKVTAFRPQMAVHGRYQQACPDCGAPIQRIRYTSNEANYCPGCQTGGKIYADRSLSRLLKDSWPRSLDELGDG